ncbi:MAG: hypothetical protein KF851_08625 [Pirellulaceae bacterium]|nr:hypothetical protein [Pirellulaceae bacterium]
MATSRICDALAFLQGEHSETVSNRQMSEWFQRLSAAEIGELLTELATEGELLADSSGCFRIERAIPYLAEASRHDTLNEEEVLPLIERLYRETPHEYNLRNGWLYWLAVVGTEGAMSQWRELMGHDPPECRAGIVWPFSPLLKREGVTSEQLLEILDLSMPYPAMVACAIDLINFRFREGLTLPHAGLGRVEGLANLMGVLAQQLAAVEEGKLPPDFSSEQVSRVVGDSVALLVSLCDTVALCDYRAAEGKLRQVTELRHRRLKVEAFSALARLGFDEGRDGLVGLAAEPSVRLRVLKYARELDLESKIDERYRSAEAMAASQLATWLAEPQQMGIAPSQVEVIDQRRQFWPGFDAPVECYLIRYEYGQAPQTFANVGIVGPMVYAFEHDISALSIDDCYAAFAGWQAAHEELYEVTMDEAWRVRGREIEWQLQRLRDREFEDVQPQFAARFFGDWVLVAKARHHENQGVAIVDEQEVTWYVDNAVSVDAQFAYLVYRGGRLLKMFNAAYE